MFYTIKCFNVIELPSGSILPASTICPSSQHCPEGSPEPQDCLAGYYTNSTGQPSCAICPDG